LIKLSIQREKYLSDKNKITNFEEAVLPHLNAAYNLARWLTRNEADADDVVQEAYLRAFKFFPGFHGGDSRAWMLKIVRNTCYSWLQKNRPPEKTHEFEEELHSLESSNPETILLESIDRQFLRQLLEELPREFREVVILRELEGLSYKEIAHIADLPLGTVMSRLARARQRLQIGAIAQQKGGSK
jgi:RNA polymerase sigma factor (sigma-70 family)